MLAAVTDSRHYLKICPNGALRFTPYTVRRADNDLNRLHGVDERMRLSDFSCALNTFKDLLKGFGLLGPRDSRRFRQSRMAGGSSEDSVGSSKAQTEL